MPKLTPFDKAGFADLSPEERLAHNESLSPSNQRKVDLCPAQVRHGDRAGDGCTRSKGQGTSHPGSGYCSKHGGNTQAGKKSAAREYGRELILQQKERFGGDRTSHLVANITAEMALLEEVRRSTAMVRWLEERIGQWELDHPTGDIPQADGLGLPRLVEETSKGAPGATDVQAWLVLYREERRHNAQVAKMCIDANISKRMVDIATQQGDVLVVVVREVLRALNLTKLQAQLVPTIVPQVIRKATQVLDGTEKRDAFDIVTPAGEVKIKAPHVTG